MKYLSLLLLLLALETSSAQIRLPRLVSDHMVLQRDQDINLWGWSAPREKLTVSLGGQEYKIRADKSGKWSVDLPPMAPGGPLTLRIAGKKETKVVSDILVGDVWVCSGQSNMEWVLSNTNDATAEIVSANDRKIRHFKVPRTATFEPQDTLAGGSWEVADPETAGNFTAVGYYFAKELRKSEGVPIGLLNTSWGGSRIEPWMDAKTLGYMDADALVKKLEADQAKQEQALQDFLKNKIKGEIPKTDQGMNGDTPLWHKADLNDGDWESMKLPGLWEQAGWNRLDGIVWFRKTFELSAAQAKTGGTLGLAMIDDSDITWVNGKKIAETRNAYNLERKYELPAGALQAGKNTIVVRVEDTGGGGGFHGNPEMMFLEQNGQKMDLAGDWKYKVGKVVLATGGLNDNQVATKLYNFMIHPILWYPIKGAIWYQGESNAGNVEQAEAYEELFKNMITSWRDQWGVGEFPFLWVQLANFMQPAPEPVESGWASLRASQSATLSLPNTAEAVIIDIGEANDIHPRNKKDVGYRLALGARKVAYGEDDLIFSGPVYKSMRQEGNKLRLQFDQVGKGLTTKQDKYGYLKGFAVAGADGKYVWAKAMIDGDEILVWSDAVAAPKMVRYAWADNPDDANLYNQAGLPAGPFQAKLK
ncbi:sialate O-acetylesterase [Flavilitoribacter nigricans]|uniref:9-O-acetylesterase n=1 Tax=Flavilitoribacter nigricans (strain ATCC 23147 / DSM 23189 / NBRC 102662 / NCIMB 1420 / SS-2) TaxID=1122177 RepID=A0A2D0NBM1_FLAN2|nr:sialate O-acetylesterase [Flavilitoribacter nigricans]PHN05885.1 9-O-acetylesterase [Flavilitoribacter nigricans DSM 23189 = NBRC 102662]